MLALAKGRCSRHANVELREAEAVSLPVKDGSFDAALCVQVLEYVPDATAALVEMRRVLRPGGSHRRVGRRLGDDLDPHVSRPGGTST
jgi:arsenite methyltransferase